MGVEHTKSQGPCPVKNESDRSIKDSLKDMDSGSPHVRETLMPQGLPARHFLGVRELLYARNECCDFKEFI